MDLNNKIDEKYLSISKENEELSQTAKEIDVLSVENLELDLKNKINLHIAEDFTGAVSCTEYRNLILYDKVYENDDWNKIIEKFIDDVSTGLQKLIKTKKKLSTRFKTPIRMFVRTNGRITLVDKDTDIIILDKVNPSNFDYQKAEKTFMINRRKKDTIRRHKEEKD